MKQRAYDGDQQAEQLIPVAGSAVPAAHDRRKGKSRIQITEIYIAFLQILRTAHIWKDHVESQRDRQIFHKIRPIPESLRIPLPGREIGGAVCKESAAPFFQRQLLLHAPQYTPHIPFVPQGQKCADIAVEHQLQRPGIIQTAQKFFCVPPLQKDPAPLYKMGNIGFTVRQLPQGQTHQQDSMGQRSPPVLDKVDAKGSDVLEMPYKRIVLRQDFDGPLLPRQRIGTEFYSVWQRPQQRQNPLAGKG